MVDIEVNKIFFISETMFKGSTPPGTGVMWEHFGATSSNLKCLINPSQPFLIHARDRTKNQGGACLG